MEKLILRLAAALCIGVVTSASGLDFSDHVVSASLGGGRVEASGRNRSLNRGYGYGDLFLGLRMYEAGSGFIGVYGQTFKMSSVEPDGRFHGQKGGSHGGVGTGVRLGILTKWIQGWIGLGGGILRARYQSSDAYPRESRYTFFSPQAILGVNLHSSDGASVALNYQAQKIYADQEWEIDHGYDGQLIMQHLELTFALYTSRYR